MSRSFKTPVSAEAGLLLPTPGLVGGILLAGDTNLYRSAAKRLQTDGALYIGDPAAGIAQLYVIGGASGQPIVTLERTAGAPSKFSWALAGGGLSFSDDVAGFVVLNVFGSGGGNAVFIGQQGRTVATTRASLLSAETYSPVAGADVPANPLRLQGGLGVGTSAPGDIEFYTGNAALTTVAHASTLKARLKAITGQLQLPGQGQAAGILLGGDANLYRDIADVLRTDDKFVCGGFQLPAGAAAGRVLTSDASGNGSWTVPSGAAQIVPRTYKDMTDSAISGVPIRTP
jgi:hypothetical protein